MKDRTFMALSSLFFLLFFVLVGSVALNQPINSILKAKNIVPSPLKSFGVVFPQVAKISNITTGETGMKVKISVYIRGVDGSILPRRTVQLSSERPLSIEPADTVETNEIGQAEFLVSSSQVGRVKVTAIEMATNTEIINIPTIEFIR